MKFENKVTICEKLIESHNNARNHISKLIEDVDDEQWQEIPANSAWSIQTIGAEILNYEIKTLNKFTDLMLPEVSEDLSIDDFRNALVEQSEQLIRKLKNENRIHGFVYRDKNTVNPSMHWIMVRTIQHSIYHTGGISVLRHLVGLPRGIYEYWEQMVDSVFLSGIIPN